MFLSWRLILESKSRYCFKWFKLFVRWVTIYEEGGKTKAKHA
jgi:hypothetical protein